MLDILFVIVIACIIIILFSDFILSVLLLIQRIVFYAFAWFLDGQFFAKIATTIIILWILKKIIKWLFE